MVKCLVCDKEFLMINSTHLKKHGITCGQYKERFPGKIFQCDSIRRMHREVGISVARNSILREDSKEKSRKATSIRSKEMWRVKREEIISKQNEGKRKSELFKEVHRKIFKEMPYSVRKSASSKGGASCIRIYGMLGGEYSVPTLYNGIKYRSMSEAKMASLFDKMKINFEYEKRIIELNIDGYKRFHTPDFYIPEFSTFLEVKGYENQKAIRRMEEAKKLNHSYVMITTAQIRKFEHLYFNEKKEIVATASNGGEKNSINCWKLLIDYITKSKLETASVNV